VDITLFEIYNEFSKRLGEFGDIYLAGGCVRDHLMSRKAKDFDLFILNNILFNDFEKTKDKILEKLKDLPVVPSLVSWHKSEPYLVITVKYKGVEVQILLNPSFNVLELLSTFDWNVCLFAYGLSYGKEQFITQEIIENIGEGKELKLNKITFPLSTLRRGFRFSERFLMKLRKEDILSLCSQIVEKSKTGRDIGPEGNEPDMESLEKNVLVK